MPRRKTKRVMFPLELSDRERTKLEVLADYEGKAMAQVLRSLIMSAPDPRKLEKIS